MPNHPKIDYCIAIVIKNVFHSLPDRVKRLATVVFITNCEFYKQLLWATFDLLMQSYFLHL